MKETIMTTERKAPHSGVEHSDPAAEVETWRLSNESLQILPEHMRDGARRYVEHGLADVDSFLFAVASNDLRAAFRRADKTNAARMQDWVLFFCAYLPSYAWGSREAAKRWLETGGMQGAVRRADNAAATETGQSS
jgi:hypothetical protein